MIFDCGLFVGHGTSEVDGSFDSGAVYGSTREYDLAKKITDKTISLLNGTGLVIHKDEQNFKDNDSKGNTYNHKFILSVHINAGKGEGTEIYVPLGEKVFELEEEILNNMTTLGFKNRGVKSRYYDTEATVLRKSGAKLSGTDYYKEIRDAWNNGISLSILEVGFIDSSDLAKIQNNIDKISSIIANAICNLCNVKMVAAPGQAVDPNWTSTNNNLYRVKLDGVQVGAYKDIKNILSSIEGAINKGALDIKIEKV